MYSMTTVIYQTGLKYLEFDQAAPVAFGMKLAKMNSCIQHSCASQHHPGGRKYGQSQNFPRRTLSTGCCTLRRLTFCPTALKVDEPLSFRLSPRSRRDSLTLTSGLSLYSEGPLSLRITHIAGEESGFGGKQNTVQCRL